MKQDKTSKYFEVEDCWQDKDLNGNLLLAGQIPGQISKLQGFRGTVCRVRDRAALERLINGKPSPAYLAIEQARFALVQHVQNAIRQLHWKDFETLVDLIFRQAGWRRISLLGQTMEFADLELQDPITGDLYQVQVKSSASQQCFLEYATQFSSKRFRKLYFVVHSPDSTLASHICKPDDAVELVLPQRLAVMIVDAGLVRWVMEKVR